MAFLYLIQLKTFIIIFHLAKTVCFLKLGISKIIVHCVQSKPNVSVSNSYFEYSLY